MGCLTSKLSQVGKTVPDVPAHLNVVETVYQADGKEANGNGGTLPPPASNGRPKAPGHPQQVVALEAVKLEETNTGGSTSKKVMDVYRNVLYGWI